MMPSWPPASGIERIPSARMGSVELFTGAGGLALGCGMAGHKLKPRNTSHRTGEPAT